MTKPQIPSAPWRLWYDHPFASLTGGFHPVACTTIDPEIAAGAVKTNLYFISDA